MQMPFHDNTLPLLASPAPPGRPTAMVHNLLRREVYLEPKPTGVEMRHTHASWVFLTDTEAWKVKRPVEDRFRDLSDPEKRRLGCEAELLLGRRLAPDVYRGVVPVHLGPNGHTFTGGGPVVDHALRMRRLADEDSALLLLASKKLTATHLQLLAARLARFYQASATAPEMGTPSILAVGMQENHADLLPFADHLVDRILLVQIRDWQRQMIDTHRGLLVDRATGRVRDGHGDLRLDHVYFAGGLARAPLVTNPIEFSRRLRCCDAALDVAALAVDLDAHHRSDLAAAFLSAFAAATNDHEFYPVLDLYLSHQACVRAKVACLVAADARTAPAKASRKAREAAALLSLAASYMRRHPADLPGSAH